ncbi:MAG: DUF2062 domain-containing protein [Betaproteobacteria bacterium]
MPRRLFNRLTSRLQPAVDKVTSNPWVQRYLPSLADPDLWHLNRRSAARAVAVGLFCGLIPGPLQIAAAILLCMTIRANFPVAVITTLYTNPLTIVPLYVVAYEYGSLFFPGAAPASQLAMPPSTGLMDFAPALFHWMTQLGKPLALGLVLLAVTLAAIGWVVVRVGWRCHTVWTWRRRARLRAAT